MSSIRFLTAELTAAVSRGVRQFVLIGSPEQVEEALQTPPDQNVRLFAVDESPPSQSPATFISTQFASEALPAALEKSDFNQRQSSVFVWLGGATYRTIDAALASLAFIASLPKGSGVVFNYTAEHTGLASLADAALDVLASRICGEGGTIRHRIQPPAVSAMLHGLGFQKIIDVAQEELQGATHLVSAMV